MHVHVSTSHSRAGALIGYVRNIGIESQSNRYAALSTYGRLPVRSADSTERERRGRDIERVEREGEHCKLTVIAFNVTRAHGRIKVNCSERRCAARNAAIGFAHSCDHRERCTITRAYRQGNKFTMRKKLPLVPLN